MVGFSALCNRWLSSGDILVADRDWEDDLIDQIQFMYDNGFRAIEDNGMKSRSKSIQEKISRIKELEMNSFVIGTVKNKKEESSVIFV